MTEDAPGLPAAVVFDCDGTLVDTEPPTVDAMRAALASLGHELTDEDVALVTGHTWPFTRDHLVARFGLTEDDLSTYGATVRELLVPAFGDDALVFDDAAAVVAALDGADVPLAVCTSSGQEHLDRMLALTPLRDRFDATVARQDTDRHKPDPAPYLLAVARLSVAAGRDLDPAEVTVVEDSDTGVAAAVAAGCFVVAVDRGAGMHDLGGAHRVVDRITLGALRHDRGDDDPDLPRPPRGDVQRPWG